VLIFVAVRQRRIETDLVHDDPEKHLIKEVEVIQGALALLIRTKEQIIEQIRCVTSLPFVKFCRLQHHLLSSDSPY